MVAERIQVAVTAILCGPATPTDDDLAMVRDFDAWLRGDRGRWDDNGDDVDPPPCPWVEHTPTGPWPCTLTAGHDGSHQPTDPNGSET